MKSRRRLSKKHRKTKKKHKKSYKGGHPHQDLPHYHLFIRFPSGRTNEMDETFLRSEKSRGLKAVTVKDIEEYAKRFVVADRPFTLFWRDKKLSNSNLKLRRVIVDGKKITPYNSGPEEAIIVKYNDTIDPDIPEVDIDKDDVDTPETE